MSIKFDVSDITLKLKTKVTDLSAILTLLNDSNIEIEVSIDNNSFIQNPPVIPQILPPTVGLGSGSNFGSIQSTLTPNPVINATVPTVQNNIPVQSSNTPVNAITGVTAMVGMGDSNSVPQINRATQNANGMLKPPRLISTPGGLNIPPESQSMNMQQDIMQQQSIRPQMNVNAPQPVSIPQPTVADRQAALLMGV